jgi:hypothetical protein
VRLLKFGNSSSFDVIVMSNMSKACICNRDAVFQLWDVFVDYLFGKISNKPVSAFCILLSFGILNFAEIAI